jgi:hypothetical protein
MSFIPDQSKKATDVPYYDDVTSSDGWQGQSTTKSVESLKAEVTSALGRLGGLVIGFQRGSFQEGNKIREGFQVRYLIEGIDGKMVPGRLDIAALPVKDDYRMRRSMVIRKDKSLRMALYMLRMSLDGLWFLQQLSPGYAALMPWMLADGDKTISQLWSESSVMSNLLPPGDGEWIDGEVKEIKNLD